jgi:hypothetical protein
MWRGIVKLKFRLIYLSLYLFIYWKPIYSYRLSIKECRIADGSGIRHHKKCLVWEIIDKNVKTMTI